MLAKTSKEVVDRQKSCMFLLTALLLQGRWVAQRLLGLVRPNLEEGDAEPGFYLAIVALARNLKAFLDRLVAADERVYAINARLRELRALRPQQIAAVSKAVDRLRHAIISQHRSPNLERIGIERPNPRTAMGFLRMADRIDETFAGEAQREILGEPVFADAPDLGAHVAEVHTTAGDLRQNLQQIDEGTRELDEALVAKKKAKDSYDEQFLHTARPFESFCLLIGEEELAAKVRPSLRQRGRTETPPDGGEGEQEAAGQPAVPEPGSGVGEEAGAETAEVGSDSAED